MYHHILRQPLFLYHMMYHFIFFKKTLYCYISCHSPVYQILHYFCWTNVCTIITYEVTRSLDPKSGLFRSWFAPVVCWTYFWINISLIHMVALLFHGQKQLCMPSRKLTSGYILTKYLLIPVSVASTWQNFTWRTHSIDKKINFLNIQEPMIGRFFKYIYVLCDWNGNVESKGPLSGTEGTNK